MLLTASLSLIYCGVTLAKCMFPKEKVITKFRSVLELHLTRTRGLGTRREENLNGKERGFLWREGFT
uniref:Secreted protein n=1 Tax=Ascaris lumbricoides TaxID=6252 RepID=A0A0M3HQC6_ASCLU